MKYFTKEWCFGNLKESMIQETEDRYRGYIKSIYNRMSFSLKILYNNINMHDGIIRKVSFFKKSKTLIMQGVFGDLEVGYFLLSIKYNNVSKVDRKLLVKIFENKEAEILSDEIEYLSDGNISHKMIFSTKKEIDIQFEDIELDIRNAISSDYDQIPCALEFL